MSITLKHFITEHTYYDCGKGPVRGHRHMSEETALRCFEKQQSRPESGIDFSARRYQGILRWIECQNMAQVGREFGVAGGTVFTWVHRYLRRAGFAESHLFPDVRSDKRDYEVWKIPEGNLLWHNGLGATLMNTPLGKERS